MDFEAVQERLGASPRLGWSGSNQAAHSRGRCRSGEARTEVCQALAVGESEPGLTSTLVF